MNPKVRECAENLAREYHDTQERKRCPASEMERYSWDETHEAERELMIGTFYSLIFQGVIICPIPDHRNRIDLREAATS